MQMRRMYETTNRKIRAEKRRKDAQECREAGMLDLAWINQTEADILDPQIPYEDFQQ